MGIRTLCSRSVLKFLTAEMNVRRFIACKHNISLMDEIGPRFLENIVTEDVYKKRVKGVGITKSEASKCSLHATTHKKIVMITVF